jgi:RecB family exonuclease
MDSLPEFSASRFNLYKTCPRLYKMQYIEGLESNKHVYTVMGSALHHAIEEYYAGKTNFLPIFTGYYNEAIASAMDTEHGLVAANLIGKASQLGQSILRELNWDQFNPTHIEYGFKIPFPLENPLVLMRGFIDMITDDGCIIDHKSGSKKPTSVELANNPQLLIYVWAYEHLFGVKPKAVYWHHLRTLELVEAKVMDNYDEKIKKLEETLVHILKDVDFPKIPRGYFCDRICAHVDLCWPSTDYEESPFIT